MIIFVEWQLSATNSMMRLPLTEAGCGNGLACPIPTPRLVAILMVSRALFMSMVTSTAFMHGN